MKIVIIRKLFCVAIYRDLVIVHQGIRISVFIKGNIAPELPLEEALCIFILISIYVTDRTVCLIDRSALVPPPPSTTITAENLLRFHDDMVDLIDKLRSLEFATCQLREVPDVEMIVI